MLIFIFRKIKYKLDKKKILGVAKFDMIREYNTNPTYFSYIWIKYKWV